MRGRKFFGAFDATLDEYWVCVQLRASDDPAGLRCEIGELPGGRYLRSQPRGRAAGGVRAHSRRASTRWRPTAHATTPAR